MRRHSRWIVAAVTALLALALASPAGARAHRRTHTETPPPPAAAPAQPPQPPQAPTSGVHPGSREPVVPPPAVAGTGKGVMSVASIDPRDVETILGKSVRSSAGEDMGRLVDVVVDRDGRPRAAIIDFGGFLGVGSRKIAVDWGVLRFTHDNAKGDLITVELTRDQVKAAPEFKEGSAMAVLGPGTTPNPAPGVANPEPKPQAQEK
jgi:hypothetical protein